MDSKKLPVRLGREPLVEALFELRFVSRLPASNILPGALYPQLARDGTKVDVVKLPLSDVPEAVRRADAQLQFAPLVKLEWPGYQLLVSDSSLALACAMPYPGWKVFKASILNVVDAVSKVAIVEALSRYSLKYVDVVPAGDLREQVASLNWNVRIGAHTLESEVATVRMEIVRSNFIHILGIQSGGIAHLSTGKRLEGIIVDVDSIHKLSGAELDMAGFLASLPNSLDSIHAANKAMFFDCLTDATVLKLEPTYD